MALVLRGGGSVIWSQHQDAFPYIKGMLVIFLSWVCSPISAGAFIFTLPGCGWCTSVQCQHQSPSCKLLPQFRCCSCMCHTFSDSRMVRNCAALHHNVPAACSHRVVDPVHRHPCAHSALAPWLHTRLLGEDALPAAPIPLSISKCHTRATVLPHDQLAESRHLLIQSVSPC